jgi:hypothetical protein
VILRWLLYVFPVEMARGWRLVRRDLLLWVALLALLALGSLSVASGPALAPPATEPGTGQTAATEQPAAEEAAPDAGTAATAPQLEAPQLEAATDTAANDPAANDSAPAPALAQEPPVADPGATLLWGVLVPFFYTFLAAVLFDAAARGVELDWPQVLRRLAARGLPLFGYLLLTATLVVGAVTVLQAGLLLALHNVPYGLLMSGGAGVVFGISLAARFAMVPFLTVLQAPEDVARLLPGEGPWAAPARTLWPLAASAAMTEGRRWRIAPYVAINLAGALPAALVPAELLVPTLVLAQLFMLTAQAVVFEFFRDARKRLELPVRVGEQSSADPA